MIYHTPVSPPGVYDRLDVSSATQLATEMAMATNTSSNVMSSNGIILIVINFFVINNFFNYFYIYNFNYIIKLLII